MEGRSSSIIEPSLAQDEINRLIENAIQFEKKFNPRIENFYLEDIKKLLRDNFHHLVDIYKKDVILICGYIHNGKSTLTNHLLGHGLERKKVSGQFVMDIQSDEQNENIPHAEIAHHPSRGTLCVELFKTQEEIYIVDCPGFRKSDGHLIDCLRDQVLYRALNAMTIRLAIWLANSIKGIIFVTKMDFLAFGEADSDEMELASFIKMDDKLSGSIITVVPENDMRSNSFDANDIRDRLKENFSYTTDKLNGIDDKESYRAKRLMAYQYEIDLLRNSKIIFSDFLNTKSRHDIINLLKTLNPIPKEKFILTDFAAQSATVKEDSIDNLVLVTGVTGSGTSTLINYLSGVKYKYQKNKDTGVVSLESNSSQEIPTRVGHGLMQQTCSAQLIKNGDFYFIDCPAIDKKQKTYDENGKSIYDSLGVLPIIKQSKNVRALILVLEWSSLNDFDSNTEIFRSLTHILNALVKDPQSLFLAHKKPLLVFAISKLPRPGRDEYFDIKELKEQVLARTVEIANKIKNDQRLKLVIPVLDLMSKQLDHVFMMRGYQGDEQDQEDDRKALLNYLEELRKNQCNIPLDKFIYDAKENNQEPEKYFIGSNKQSLYGDSLKQSSNKKQLASAKKEEKFRCVIS